MTMKISTWVRVGSQTMGKVVGPHVHGSSVVVVTVVGSIVVVSVVTVFGSIVVERFSGQSFSIQAPPNFQPLGVAMSSMVPSES